MASAPHVLVVGAGIIGASIAWHLARAGTRVTVVEASAPGGIATRNSFAWINASRGNPAPYFRLRHHAMAEWRRLERELAEIRVAWTGSLLWGPSADQLAAFVAEHADWGYAIRRVGRAEAARIEPHLLAPPDDAVHVAEEGAVEPTATALALLRAAQALGATVLADSPVRRLERRGGGAVAAITDAGAVPADQVVLAAGAGSVSLASGIGCALPLDNPAALLIVSRPLSRRLLNGLVLIPETELRQTAEGRLVVGAALTSGAGDGTAAATEIFDRARRMLRGGDALALESHVVGHRPMPRDRLPLVGRPAGIDNLYIAVTHSGITLAPAIGRIVAAEVLTGRRDPLVAPFGLSR